MTKAHLEVIYVKMVTYVKYKESDCFTRMVVKLYKTRGQKFDKNWTEVKQLMLIGG